MIASHHHGLLYRNCLTVLMTECNEWVLQLFIGPNHAIGQTGQERREGFTRTSYFITFSLKYVSF